MLPSFGTLAIFTLILALLVSVAGLFVRGRQRSDAETALSSAVKRVNTQPPEPGDSEDLTSKSRWRVLFSRLASIGKRLDASRFGKLLLADEDQVMLDQAGWGNTRSQSIFVGIRASLAILLPLALLFFIDLSGIRVLFVLIGAAAAGILLPKFALRQWTNRQRKIANDELPLFIDLLRLLQSVGFSVDQSLQMLGDKLRPALPVIGRELSIANLAYSRGRSRELSLQRLSESFRNDDLRSLVQMIVQVHSHGGAVQEPLKQFGMRLREKRRMEMKEKIGKLSVKMTMVMMVTLLPALMLVLAGPAVVALSKAVSQMGS